MPAKFCIARGIHTHQYAGCPIGDQNCFMPGYGHVCRTAFPLILWRAKGYSFALYHYLHTFIKSRFSHHTVTIFVFSGIFSYFLFLFATKFKKVLNFKTKNSQKPLFVIFGCLKQGLAFCHHQSFTGMSGCKLLTSSTLREWYVFLKLRSIRVSTSCPSS